MRDASLGYSRECFNIHIGSPFIANLGDGQGWFNETVEIRFDYGSSSVGTCLESLIGGNHLRLWQQTGPKANSGAMFLA